MGFNTGKYTENPYIKGDDLEEGERLVLTIQSAEEVTFPSGDTVPVVKFLETHQKLTLNKTRIKRLVELLGDDTDEWSGQQIALYPVPVQYNGQSMMGVAVGPPKKKAKAKPVTQDVVFMSEDEDDEGSPF